MLPCYWMFPTGRPPITYRFQHFFGLNDAGRDVFVLVSVKKYNHCCCAPRFPGMTTSLRGILFVDTHATPSYCRFHLETRHQTGSKQIANVHELIRSMFIDIWYHAPRMEGIQVILGMDNRGQRGLARAGQGWTECQPENDTANQESCFRSIRL